jgi:hypothetical protein
MIGQRAGQSYRGSSAPGGQGWTSSG